MRLVFHGAAVIGLGMLSGFPYAFVVLGQLDGSERAWRMAHLEGVLNGILLFAVAGIAGHLGLGAGRARLLAAALLVTGYGNVVASIIGAAGNVRGLSPGGSVANTVVYLLFMAALVGVFLALGLIAAGARARHLDARAAQERMTA